MSGGMVVSLDLMHLLPRGAGNATQDRRAQLPPISSSSSNIVCAVTQFAVILAAVLSAAEI